jgi:DNA-binding MarR family transcriptional regulator
MFDHCLYFNTTALARRLEREWATAFQAFGLTPAQAFMLRAVLAQPGLLQSQLAQAMDIARPTATRALDMLQTKGLIRRQANTHDGRETEIHPTDQALALHTALNQASAAVTTRLKQQLGDQSFVQAVAQVKDVRAALT